MGIATYACYSFHPEIKEHCFETGFLKEGNQEGSKAAVYVERDLAFYSEFREGGDVVDNSMGEVRR